ncbi:MAG TPA: ribose ABC transporter permease, partial [Myxococcales bacterium]
EAARLSGIPIVSVKLFTYGYSGLAAALGGLVLAGRLNSAQPTAGSGFELDAIAAAVVGGASLSGGRGGVIGSFLGAAIIGVLNNGMNLLNVSAFYQQIVKGAVILGALLIDRLVAARRE